MKMNASGLIMVFGWSIFMGVTAISIGFGALFPPMNLVAKPFVCPSGRMYFDETSSNPLPGTTYTQIYWHCTDDRTGATTDLDIFPMALYAGIIYGLLLFVVILVGWVILNARRAPETSSTDPWAAGARLTESNSRERSYAPAGDFYGGSETEEKGRTAHAHLERMKELKELHESGMISDEEFSQKRAEILKEL